MKFYIVNNKQKHEISFKKAKILLKRNFAKLESNETLILTCFNFKIKELAAVQIKKKVKDIIEKQNYNTFDIYDKNNNLMEFKISHFRAISYIKSSLGTIKDGKFILFVNFKRKPNFKCEKKEYFCKKCKSNERITFHHIFPKRYYFLKGNQELINNTIPLCKECHKNYEKLSTFIEDKIYDILIVKKSGFCQNKELMINLHNNFDCNKLVKDNIENNELKNFVSVKNKIRYLIQKIYIKNINLDKFIEFWNFHINSYLDNNTCDPDQINLNPIFVNSSHDFDPIP